MRSTLRFPVRPGTALPFALLAALTLSAALAPAAPAAAETRVRVVAAEQLPAVLEAMEAGRPSPATGPARPWPGPAASAGVEAPMAPPAVLESLLAARRAGTLPRTSVVSRLLIVPYYRIDPSSGETTLFAIRNANLFDDVMVNVYFLGVQGGTSGAYRMDTINLGGKETLTVNVRDVSGLPADPDGVKRGWILIEQLGVTSAALTGDYFQVDLDDNFATGSTMLGSSDTCDNLTVRFLDGGPINGGTNGFLLLLNPKGSNPAVSPPSVVVTFYNEFGVADNSMEIYTDDNLLLRDFSTFHHIDNFGSYDISFGSDGGFAGVTFSASGKYSIGLHGMCITP